MRADEMNLNSIVEFYMPFQVTAPGFVEPILRHHPSPGDSQYADHNADGTINIEPPDGWTLVSGYSGQYGYRGPIMHDSEFLGGGMARDVLARPGFYCLLPVIWLDDDTDDNMSGWVLLYQPDPAVDDYTEEYR